MKSSGVRDCSFFGDGFSSSAISEIVAHIAQLRRRFAPGQQVADGNCVLRFIFDGKKEEGKYRVRHGELVAGWVTMAAR